MTTTAIRMGGSKRRAKRAMSPLPPKNPNKKTYSGRVAARIRELREAKGWSLADLHRALEADGLPMVPSLLSHYEAGKRKVNPDDYPKFAKALGCKSVTAFLPTH